MLTKGKQNKMASNVTALEAAKITVGVQLSLGMVGALNKYAEDNGIDGQSNAIRVILGEALGIDVEITRPGRKASDGLDKEEKKALIARKAAAKGRVMRRVAELYSAGKSDEALAVFAVLQEPNFWERKEWAGDNK